MIQSRHLSRPMILLAATLILFPIMEVIISSLPFRIGNTQWRFGVEGLLSGALFFQMIGILILLASATFGESSRLAKSALWTSVLMAVLLIALSASFALDALQLYSTLPEKVRPSFRHATILSVLRSLVSLAVLVSVAIAARRLSREVRPAKASAADSALISRSTAAPPIRPAM